MGIKLIDPNAVLKIVSLHDGAIDKANTDMVEYAKNYDTSLLKFLEGEVPTYWVIYNIGSDELVNIQQEHYVTEMPKIEEGESFEDMKNKKVKVTTVRQGEMIMKYFKAGCRKMIDGDVETLLEGKASQVPSMIISEIGSFIMVRSTIGDAKKK